MEPLLIPNSLTYVVVKLCVLALVILLWLVVTAIPVV